MQDIFQLTGTIRALLDSQRLAVLSTQEEGAPYGSLVAFAVTADLRDLIFATTRATRKYANIISESRVALVIDSRTNQPSDFGEAEAVTALGVASEVADHEKEACITLYTARHPALREFVASPTCALLKVKVDRYLHVRQFQNVQELQIRE